jgi:hypothetical protein
MTEIQEQSHPLHATDRQVVDGLLAVSSPEEQHLVDAARLLNRYDGFPGASDLRHDLEKLLTLWKLDRPSLQQRTRAIWAAGFRPGPAAPSEAVGSGFDTTGDQQS